MYFKLKPNAGTHTQKDENGRYVTYKASDGDLIESDFDLCALFAGKFELVEVPTVDKTDTDEIEEDTSIDADVDVEEIDVCLTDKEVKDKYEKEKPEESKPLGADFTEKFNIAVENEFKVFYVRGRGKGYFVAEVDEPHKALNEKGLKKEEVEPFIQEVLKG